MNACSAALVHAAPGICSGKRERFTATLPNANGFRENVSDCIDHHGEVVALVEFLDDLFTIFAIPTLPARNGCRAFACKACSLANVLVAR